MKKKFRIKLKSYDVSLLDKSTQKIIKVAESTGAKISGPIPLPTRRELFTVLRSVHVNKKSREQYELRTHKRMLEILELKEDTIDKLNRVELPAGVFIEIKA